MNRNVFSEGIVLWSKPYSEADKIVAVFSKNYGKLVMIAKGVRRPKSRKRGALEVFSAIKFYAFKGRGMPVLTETELVQSFGEIRNDLNKVSVAYFFAETVSRTTSEEVPHDEIYDILLDSLETLCASTKLKSLRREFTIRMLTALGFIPEGQFVPNADDLLESVVERKLGSVRVGKKIQG